MNCLEKSTDVCDMYNMKATTTVRIDADSKSKAETVLKELGLPLSAAINAFLLSIARNKEVPLDLSLRTPNAETEAAIAEAHAGKTKKHSSLSALRSELAK